MTWKEFFQSLIQTITGAVVEKKLTDDRDRRPAKLVDPAPRRKVGKDVSRRPR